jgi:3-oxoacyl-[acyl-carrier protein] reductase
MEKGIEQPLSLTDLDLDGRVALVTGGSRGIGRAVVELLATNGANVAINYRSDRESADSAAAFAESKNVSAITIKANVANLKEADYLVQETVDRLGKIDFLICNAGIWQGRAVESISEELWDQTIDINLKGTWTVCRAAVPRMKEQKFGRIVVVSSTAGQRGEANVSNYAASKGGQISFMKSLSTELAGFGINVNCVAPGWVSTEMSEKALSDKERLRSIISTIPLGRPATAEEIAGPIVFLCSRWANHITGEVLNVNGGSVLCG